MLDHDGHIKLVEAALNKGLGCSGVNATGPCCAQDYKAPELAGSKDGLPSADFWALGVALFKMLTGIIGCQCYSALALSHAVFAVSFTQRPIHVASILCCAAAAP